MNQRRILVNACIILVLVVIGYICFSTGRAYNVIVENVPVTVEDVTYEALPAVQVFIDQAEAPTYLLDGDRMVSSAMGTTHVLTIEILDEEDKPTETVKVPFTMKELQGTPRIINVPYFYAKAVKK